MPGKQFHCFGFLWCKVLDVLGCDDCYAMLLFLFQNRWKLNVAWRNAMVELQVPGPKSACFSFLNKVSEIGDGDRMRKLLNPVV